MSDVLSQSEIDNLLSVLSSGGQNVEEDIKVIPDSKEIKEYNFAKPPKFNKDHLRTLEVIFDNYARATSSFLSGYLRANVTLEVTNAEQLTYKEFNNSLSNPVILAIIDFLPLKGSILLDLSPTVGYAIIDRVLGGPGVGVKKIRDFSEIEKILLKRITSQITNFLIDPWENVVAIRPRVEKLETNPQFAQIISPNEMVALVTLRIKVGTVEGAMNFCIPHLVVEPIMDKMNMKYWFTSKTEDEDTMFKETMENRLEIAEIPISAVIGKTNIMVSDFVNLQVGDVIPLDSFINSDMEVYVGDLHKFNAKPGISRKKNSVQVTSLVRKEDV